MLILMLIEAFMCLGFWKWFHHSAQQQKLRGTGVKPTIPILGKAMKRASGGEIKDWRTRKGAAMLKNGIRWYVNSPLFDDAVNAVMNQKSPAQGFFRKLRNLAGSTARPNSPAYSVRIR